MDNIIIVVSNVNGNAGAAGARMGEDTARLGEDTARMGAGAAAARRAEERSDDDGADGVSWVIIR